MQIMFWSSLYFKVARYETTIHQSNQFGTLAHLQSTSLRKHLSNISLAFVLSSLLQEAKESSSCMSDDVPSAAPTHNNLPDS